MIDVEVVSGCEPVIDYPKLMISEGETIVYFTEDKVGQCVESPNYKFLHFSDRWNMDSFSDFHGGVMLKNKVKS